MKIPTEISLAGLTWNIKCVDPQSHELITGTTIGHIYYDQLLIVYSNHLHPDIAEQTVLHELLHAIMFMLGKATDDKTDLDEGFIDSFAMYQHQILQQFIDYNIIEELTD